MFNDRDLAVIGVGAVLAIFCLLIPAAFSWKVTLGLIVLVSAMVAALLRLGADHLTLEEWLRRRIRYALRPRAWSYHERRLDRPRLRKTAPPETPAAVEPHVLSPGADTDQPVSRPWTFDFTSVSGERLAGLLLGLVGVYFIYALWTGSAAELAALFAGGAP